MSKLSDQPWFERAVRQHADEHGPSGGAWNISMILDLLHRAHETGASGAERMRERAADLAGSIWPRGGAHTYASENADRYYALEDASEAIAAAIRALPTDGE